MNTRGEMLESALEDNTSFGVFSYLRSNEEYLQKIGVEDDATWSWAEKGDHGYENGGGNNDLPGLYPQVFDMTILMLNIRFLLIIPRVPLH